MPLYTQSLDELDESIIRPAVFDVATRVFDTLELPKDTPLLFKADGTQYAYKGSTIESIVDNKQTLGTNRYQSDAIFYIETDVEDNENAKLSQYGTRMDELRIFEDKALNVFIYPVMGSKIVKLNITVMGTATQVDRWRSTMKRIASQDAQSLVHTVQYSYPIPNGYMGHLARIYNMRNNVAGYGDSFREYFDKHTLSDITILKNENSRPQFNVCQINLPITGWFEYGNNPPKPQRSNDGIVLHTLEFSYNFYLDVPETVVMYTPCIIHNQQFPLEYLDQRIPLQIQQMYAVGSSSQESLNQHRFNSQELYYRLPKVGIPYPFYDDWLGDRPPSNYLTLLKMLVQVDPDNKLDVCNYQNMGDCGLYPPLLPYLKKTFNWMKSNYDCIIYSQQYRWDELLGVDKTVIDSELNVTTVDDMNLRDINHHTLSVLADPSMLSDRGKWALWEFPGLARYYLASLFPWLIKIMGWDINNWDGDGFPMTDIEWNKAISHLDQSDLSDYYSNQTRQWELVGRFTIIANLKG